MAAHNPYAPSRATLKVADVAGSSDGVRRDGKWIVMPVDASLPHRCVKCNEEPEEPTKQRTLYWHHPALYVVALINLLIYAIVASLVRKHIKVSPALCPGHGKKRRKIIIYSWLGMLASVVLPFMFVDSDDVGGALIIAILLFIASALFGVFGSRLLYAKKIDVAEARIGGAGVDFLDSLPE